MQDILELLRLFYDNVDLVTIICLGERKLCVGHNLTSLGFATFHHPHFRIGFWGRMYQLLTLISSLLMLVSNITYIF
jgi:hypothetical protein